MSRYRIQLLFCLIVGVNAGYYDSESIHNSILNKIEKVEGLDFITWCTSSELEQKKCEALANATMLDKGLFGKDYIELACKQAFDTEECMTWVDTGEATLLALDAGEVYVAGRFHSLVPILQEISVFLILSFKDIEQHADPEGRRHSRRFPSVKMYGRGELYQYAVAVVKKGALQRVRAGEGLHAMRGARACFPGVGALAGWVLPIHTLMQEGGLKIIDCNNHVKSAIEYFGESCAANSLKDMYNPIGDNSDQLCKLCTGGAGRRCTLADPFAGYDGALQCLMADDAGEVAFVRDSTIQHALLSHKVLGGVSEDQFELICRDGSRAPVTEWERCNWGRVPSDAIVTSSANSPKQRQRFQNYVMKLVQLYGEPNSLNKVYNQTYTAATQGYQGYQNREPYGGVSSSTEYPGQYYDSFKRSDPFRRDEDTFGKQSSTTPSPYQARLDSAGHPIEPRFKLFHSEGTVTDLLVQDATISFMVLEEEKQAAKHILNNEYVGDRAEKAVVGIRDCPVKRATICITSDPEMEKCVKMRVALKAAFLFPTLVCWRGHSTRHCERAIADGSCDFALFDAGDMLHAASTYRLVPFMQELYSSGNAWYYAVAVAKEQDPDTDLTYLKGKNTCHTGIATAAGWMYPLAYLISNGWMRSYGCDGAHAAAEYFSKSCAPGALSSEYVDADSVPHDHLCHLCHGASYRRCRRDASEDYYGHVGALRCMVEGGGDVAFVRHTTPAEVAGGRRSEWWARDLLPDDLQLLCPDGTRTKIHEYKHCNLGKVPGSVLMGRPNHTELDTFSNLMIYAQQMYGVTTSDDFSFSMFYSQPPYSDLIFSDAAKRLKPLPHNQRSAEILAGSALPRAARIVSCDAPQASYYIASDPNFLNGAQTLGTFGYVLSLIIIVAFAL